MPDELVDVYMKATKQPLAKGKKTHDYQVTEKKTGNLLGAIRWYGPWRGYCFFPACGVVFDAGCLCQIADWLSELKCNYKEYRALLKCGTGGV